MRKVNRKLVALEIENKLGAFNGSWAIARHLAVNRHMSAQRIEARLAVAEAVGLVKRGESNGLAYLGLTQPMFAEKIRAAQVGLTLKQRDALSFLVGIMVPKEMALRMCKTQVASRDLFLKRAKTIASIKLDPKKFGVERVPLHLFWKVIELPPTKMRRYIEAKILRDLENNHSRKVLDAVFPVWTKMRQVAKMEPRTILAKVEYMINEGIALSGRKIRQYSLEELKQRKAMLDRMTPLERKTFRKRLAQAKLAPRTNEGKVKVVHSE
jgi:macrodomain Ter protein organizer (MatP/YcbG family)